MVDFDFKEFHKKLQEDFQYTDELVSEWEGIGYRMAEEEVDLGLKSLRRIQLEDSLQSIRLKLLFAYEYLGLLQMAARLNAELAKYEGEFTDLALLPYIDVFGSPVQFILLRHLNALTSHIKIEDRDNYENTSSRGLLESILRNTPKMLTDRKVSPNNEAQVRAEVYHLLNLVFPDTVREIPIAKVSKTYKPDIGVKRLKSAIEYKFVTTKDEMKAAIEGIFADIKGYEGSLDWTTFYAVIYQTDHFMTQEQVEADFQLSKVPHHWKPIVVFGKGGRKPKP